ncbi:lipid-binding SYLF domain-containing protein [Candidatus Methylacidiphilum infernorum]|uniref:Lipid-binding SYLF domain-containing protein n=1 Tax=Candidatus Methylacidiphilum infernorum TaxID=511746 RepID=A0ABX7PTM9_9BACT|nr:lipid-binding SYLF domain-containing protein [Candidatus Methylacidiphilum infernorum]QSR86114.1 lipid-binding SYLF domain-containing protein [Candidatus Methylacidiphilum infernorum]
MSIKSRNRSPWMIVNGLKEKFIFLLLFFCSSCLSLRGWNLEKKVEQGASLLLEMKNRYKDTVPEPLFEEAKGVGYLSILEAGLFMKERRGNGWIAIRLPEGRWSGPLAVNVSGWDLGLEAGIKAVDLLLLFNAQETIDLIVKGKRCNIGVGQSAQPGLIELTEEQVSSPTASVYVYLISKNKIKGIKIGNFDLIADPATNWRYYKNKYIPYQILSGRVPVPESAQRLIQALAEPFRSLPVKPAERVVASPGPFH